MKESLRKLRDGAKARGEDIGLPLLIIGGLLVVLRFALVFIGVPSDVTLFALGLALISVGLGFTSLGMSAKSDKRHTDLLTMLDKKVTALPTMFRGDVLTPQGQAAMRALHQEQSKEAAQKRLDEDTQSKAEAQARLDEDTKKVGYVRGEVFQNDDGTWSIHWGGKHPL